MMLLAAGYPGEYKYRIRILSLRLARRLGVKFRSIVYTCMVVIFVVALRMYSYKGSHHPTTHFHSSQPITAGKKFIFIFAYERSGSSFLGSALNHTRDTFYMYEPLHPQHTKMMKFPRQLYGISPELIELEAGVYKRIQNCEFDHLPAEVNIMNDSFTEEKGPFKMRVFTDCMKQNVPNLEALTKTCTQLAMNYCKSKSIVLTKEVRGTMEAVGLYLTRLSSTNNVRIIHLLRDPRGCINSRIRTKWTGFKKLDLGEQEKMMRSICERMYRDVTLRQELEDKYPGVFLEIKYDDLTEDPLENFQRIYDFIGKVEFPESLKDILLLSQRHSRNKAVKWKMTLTKSRVEVIERNCKEILNHMNYSLSDYMKEFAHYRLL